MKLKNTLCSFVFAVLAIAFHPGVSRADVYDDLRESALSNGYPDIAEATRTLRDYREYLRGCGPNAGNPSSVFLGSHIDGFAQQMKYYIDHSSRRRPYRVEVEQYAANSLALIRIYFAEKKQRLHAGGSLPEADDKIVRLSRWLHSRCAEILMVGMTSVESQWRSADFSKYTSHARWGQAASAILAVRDGDKTPCTK